MRRATCDQGREKLSTSAHTLQLRRPAGNEVSPHIGDDGVVGGAVGPRRSSCRGARSSMRTDTSSLIFPIQDEVLAVNMNSQ